MRSRLASRWSALTRLEQWAWGLVLVFFVAGDTATTALVLHHGGRETSPIVRALIDTMGLVPGMLVGKAATVAVFVVLWWHLRTRDGDPSAPISPRQVALFMPATVAFLGGLATVNNLYVTLSLVGWL